MVFVSVAIVLLLTPAIIAPLVPFRITFLVRAHVRATISAASGRDHQHYQRE